MMYNVRRRFKIEKQIENTQVSKNTTFKNRYVLKYLISGLNQYQQNADNFNIDCRQIQHFFGLANASLETENIKTRLSRCSRKGCLERELGILIRLIRFSGMGKDSTCRGNRRTDGFISWTITVERDAL